MSPATALRRKAEPQRKHGLLVGINNRRGFAFIVADDTSTQYFAHVREVERSAWFENARVEFIPGEQTDPKQAPRAMAVRLALKSEDS